MSAYKVLTSLFFVLVISSPGISQEEKLKVNKETGPWEISPEMAEKMKRQSERLRDPSFIKLKIVPQSNCQDEDSKKVSDCYKAHGKIKMNVFMTNVSSETINITISRPHYPYNPQLFRDGQPVLYRKAMAEIVDKHPPFSSSFAVALEPGKAEMVGVIHLDQWYDPLEPGHYQLDVKWRFLPDGGWTDIASTTFEVEPE